ncbi:type II toxin-antitoxin system HicB family antitoxin [Moorena sp. SIO3B2]|uniref:type II toxin-antitoxin system HicB family antitoxin n=1 Tax=Moorena sp. SIO3B2 TaxID=2607827 RepID=UPI0013CB902D|nr:type II toxin-antitoxin system HicB family antitoxin [Moorena sp. SIO3B2]NEP36994.1 type II toxin-antitoxin system HicB family antitoxin [Moorena sp. SIO3B2]
MSRFSFPARFTPDESDGGFVVTFQDLPEAITQGDSIEQALAEAADCLEEAIAARIDDQLDIPNPSPPAGGDYLVPVPIQTALKAALYLAMCEAGITSLQLAHTLNTDEQEVKRILDPDNGTKLPTLERALAALVDTRRLERTAIPRSTSCLKPPCPNL